MKSLYIETTSGISGDMTVAALLDAGADETVLMNVLDQINAGGFEVNISQVKKSGLVCKDFDVVLDEAHDGHDHDMEYLYGHIHEKQNEKIYVNHGDNYTHNHNDNTESYIHAHELDIHHHDHTEPHTQELDTHHHDNIETHNHAGIHTHDGASHPHTHHHTHRGMEEINAILDDLIMTEGARNITDSIFAILAQAESQAHGVPVDQVHFHEVGAIDSIVDIVATAVCLDNIKTHFGIEKIIIPKLTEGQGSVRCQHGILPVPVPAVANIVASYNISMEIIDVAGELVTPTGAAIVAAVTTDTQLPDKFTIEKIGMGAGKRDYGLAGFVRAMIIEAE